MKKWLSKLYHNILPLYLQLWPTWLWIAMWDAGSLRITLRSGQHHEKWLATIKTGVYRDDRRRSVWHKKKGDA